MGPFQDAIITEGVVPGWRGRQAPQPPLPHAPRWWGEEGHRPDGLTVIHCARTIIKEEGITALWKGNVPCMFRQGWNQLFLFGSYDYLKQGVLGLERDAPISKHQSLTLGMIAGALGPLTNNPFDVSKTRMQGQLTTGADRKYTNMVQCIGLIFREEGFAPLMRGCMMRMARVAPGMGITFTIVETAMEHCTDQQIPFPLNIGCA